MSTEAIKLFCAIVAQAIIDIYRGKKKTKEEAIKFFKSQEYDEIAKNLDKMLPQPHFKNLKKLAINCPEEAYKSKIIQVVETDSFASQLRYSKKLKWENKKEKSQKALVA